MLKINDKKIIAVMRRKNLESYRISFLTMFGFIFLLTIYHYFLNTEIHKIFILLEITLSFLLLSLVFIPKFFKEFIEKHITQVLLLTLFFLFSFQFFLYFFVLKHQDNLHYSLAILLLAPSFLIHFHPRKYILFVFMSIILTIPCSIFYSYPLNFYPLFLTSGIIGSLICFLRFKNLLLSMKLRNKNIELKISDQIIQRAWNEVRKYVDYDALTRLPNRIFLKKKLNEAIIYSQDKKQLLALLFIDLDHFQKINDSFGHDVGDSVLLEVANRLVKSVRRSDTIARFAGDEFIVVSYLENYEEVDYILNRIQKQFANEIIIKQKKFKISLSIGLSFYPKDSEVSEDLMRFADIAMNKAKRGGRNRVEVYQSQ